MEGNFIQFNRNNCRNCYKCIRACPVKSISFKDNHAEIFALEKMPELIKRMNIHIGIITTPVTVAQSVCDMLVGAGVKAIWNFAPTSLSVPKGIIVQNENMATGLAVLSNKLNEALQGEE